jgi:ADP-ribose pyrophosphatase YjhB (NUDIX family)
MQKEKSNTPRGTGKTISVWLVIGDGKNRGFIALQKRSAKNKSFPYVCQSSWAGKVECKEAIEDAVKRECKEELGLKFFKSFDFNSLKTLKNSEFYIIGEKWTCYNYIGVISQKDLKLAKLHKEAYPKFVIAGKKSKFFPLSANKDPNKNIVFFDDQYKIIQKFSWK